METFERPPSSYFKVMVPLEDIILLGYDNSIYEMTYKGKNKTKIFTGKLQHMCLYNSALYVLLKKPNEVHILKSWDGKWYKSFKYKLQYDRLNKIVVTQGGIYCTGLFQPYLYIFNHKFELINKRTSEQTSLWAVDSNENVLALDRFRPNIYIYEADSDYWHLLNNLKINNKDYKISDVAIDSDGDNFWCIGYYYKETLHGYHGNTPYYVLLHYYVII